MIRAHRALVAGTFTTVLLTAGIIALAPAADAAPPECVWLYRDHLYGAAVCQDLKADDCRVWTFTYHEHGSNTECIG